MLSAMRDRFSKVVIVVVIVFVGFVFIFWGVFQRDLGGGGLSSAGSVNGERIGYYEFRKSVERQLEFYRQLNLPTAQLKQFGVPQSVFDSMVQNRLLVQQSKKMNWEASAEGVRDQIRKFPAFQKEGQFDRHNYEEVLRANGMTPSQFERTIEEDLRVENLRKLFEASSRVSKAEAEEQFLKEGNKRNLKYVLIEKSKFKGKPEDQLKDAEVLGAAVLNAWKSGGGLGGAVQKQLKDLSIKEATTGFQSQDSLNIPGLYRGLDAMNELQGDFFSAAHPPKAKQYMTPGGMLVVKLEGTQLPDPQKMKDEEIEKIRMKMARKKQAESFQAWQQSVKSKAVIKRNEEAMASVL